jgi:hypothetical protein
MTVAFSCSQGTYGAPFKDSSEIDNRILEIRQESYGILRVQRRGFSAGWIRWRLRLQLRLQRHGLGDFMRNDRWAHSVAVILFLMTWLLGNFIVLGGKFSQETMLWSILFAFFTAIPAAAAFLLSFVLLRFIGGWATLLFGIIAFALWVFNVPFWNINIVYLIACIVHQLFLLATADRSHKRPEVTRRSEAVT